MAVRVIGDVRGRELIASGRSIRDLRRLIRTYGRGRWRKYKAIATVELEDGTVAEAEFHWYEAPGIGAVETKPKRLL